MACSCMPRYVMVVLDLVWKMALGHSYYPLIPGSTKKYIVYLK